MSQKILFLLVDFNRNWSKFIFDLLIVNQFKTFLSHFYSFISFHLVSTCRFWSHFISKVRSKLKIEEGFQVRGWCLMKQILHSYPDIRCFLKIKINSRNHQRHFYFTLKISKHLSTRLGIAFICSF